MGVARADEGAIVKLYGNPRVVGSTLLHGLCDHGVRTLVLFPPVFLQADELFLNTIGSFTLQSFEKYCMSQHVCHFYNSTT